MTSKSVKLVSLLLLAGLANGTVYARGGGGMGGMGAEHAQREQTRTQERTQQRVRAGDGAYAASVPHENRYEFSKEDQERGVSRAGQQATGRNRTGDATRSPFLHCPLRLQAFSRSARAR